MEQEPLGEPHVIYEDQRIIAVSKPNRLLVHRTNMDFYERRNLLKWLSETNNSKLHPAHRLDKATSGIVLFTKDAEALRFLREQFNERSVAKTYLALVRGFTAEQGEIDKALKGEDDNKLRSAVTQYTTLKHTEVPIPVSRYDTSRYSLVRVKTKTGRFHQIRLHFAHLRHPVIGDTRHGDLQHNKMFRDSLKCEGLFLHASSIAFTHPDGSRIKIVAPQPAHFDKIFKMWPWRSGTGIQD